MWQSTGSDHHRGAPVVAGGWLYTSTGTPGSVQARDARTGALRWARSFGGAHAGTPASPGVAGNVVVAVVGHGDTAGPGSPLDHFLYGLDAATGRVRWRQSLGGAEAGEPTVGGGRVYVGTRDSRMRAIDVATGRLLWNRLLHDRLDSKAAYADGKLILVGESGGIRRLDARTGRELGYLNTGYFPEPTGYVPAVGGGMVYASRTAPQEPGGNQAAVLAFPLDDCPDPCAPRWTALVPGIHTQAPVVAGGRVFVAGTRRNMTEPGGGVFALDARTGRRLWQFAGRGWFQSATAAGELLYVTDNETDRLLVFNAAGCGAPTCQPLTVLEVGKRFGAGEDSAELLGPAVADRSVYLNLDSGVEDGGTLALRPSRAPRPPAVTSPATNAVPRGSTSTIRGTGVPRSTILLHVHRAGTPAADYSIKRSVTIGADGRWSRPFVADVDHRFYATRTGRPERSRSTLVQVR